MEGALKMLNDKKVPVTVQRRIILEELANRNDHPTAEEIFHTLRRKMRKLSLATVYRTLETLAQHHLIMEHHQGKNASRYEVMKGTHYHVICLRCNKMEDVFGITIEGLEQEIAKITSYRIEKHRLDVYGLCPSCRVSQIPIHQEA
ncbi:MAG: transcriptional repressor [Candidatus Abawacabacteria bacterium]|nr:transcriptional repressor [Candidatus Abawacabacteria bacterium]